MYSRRQSQGRVGLLDEVRGFCIVLMVLYHGAFDLIYIFGIDIPAFHWPILHFAQPFVAGIFIFLSGIACRYSHSNLKRGVIALALGLVMSGVTIYFMHDLAIYFGILHLLGSSMILYALLQRALDKLPALGGLLLFALLCLLTWGVPSHYVGIPGLLTWPLPASLYTVPYLFPLGFTASGFSSADYFPLLPWLFLFLSGSYMGVFFKRSSMPGFFYREHSRILAWIGRRSLIIYLLHQPVVYGILYAVFAVKQYFLG